MNAKERIYESFGELVYIVAMADGIIQQEEVDKLYEILKFHPKSEEIKWSFDYERQKHNNLEDLYNKVINRCQENGPDPEYDFLIELLEEVAKASHGTSRKESSTIKGSVHDLIARFKKDIKSINDFPR